MVPPTDSVPNQRASGRDLLPVLGFLVLSLAATVAAWSYERARVADINRLLFTQASQTIRDDTIEVMQQHVQALRGGAGFYHGSDRVTGREWAQYVADLQVAENYPGIQGMSINAIIQSPSQKQALLNDMRDQGSIDFRINPPGDRPLSVPVLYLEPVTQMNRRAVGFDIYSEPNRRAAVDEAIITGRAAMTAKITLVQEDAASGDPTQNGVLLLLPLFDPQADITTAAARRNAAQGMVVAAFRMGDLMNSVLARHSVSKEQGISIRLYDAADPLPEALLYGDTDVIDGPFTYRATFSIYGRAWTLQTAAPQFFSAATATPSPAIVAGAGVLLSIMITAFAWNQTLRASESRLAATQSLENNKQVQSLMHEVNHRSKNLLTVVRAIARLTANSEPDAFLKHFSQRIEALAASQDLLVKSAWKGTQLRDLVESQLSHFDGYVGSRIFAHGPDFQLHAAAAQTVGMALHELATNAGKYGALSNDFGKVAINWQVLPHDDGDKRLCIAWIESGGPTVSPPAQHGFGTVVTSKMVEHSLKASVTTVYAPAGFEWHFSCKIKAAQEPRPAPARQGATAT